MGPHGHKADKMGSGAIMKHRGLVTASVVLSLAAIEMTPRKETFDNPHVPQGENLQVEISDPAVMAASGTWSSSSATQRFLNEMIDHLK